MLEEPVMFGKTQLLVGVCTLPTKTCRDETLPGIILLNAGMLHRVGPNRLNVKLARKLGDMGFVTLRYDQSGIGDSEISDSIDYDEVGLCDVRSAMDHLTSIGYANEFIVIGICTGADTAIRAAISDERVIGVIGINGYYLDNNTLEQVSSKITASIQGRYYRSRLFNIRSWLRLLRGKSNVRNIFTYIFTKKKRTLTPGRHISELQYKPSYLQELLESRQIPVLLIYSEGSSAWDTYQMVEYGQIEQTDSGGKMDIAVLDGTDHVFTLLESQFELMEKIAHWTQNWVVENR